MVNDLKNLDFKSSKFAVSSWLWGLVSFLFFPSHLWLLEFLHDFSSSVFALMCYFLWFAAGGGSSCSPVLARKPKGDYFQNQIFNCIPFWFFWGGLFSSLLPTSLSCFGRHSQLPLCYQRSLNQCKFSSCDFWYCSQNVIQLFKAVWLFFCCCSSLAKLWWWILMQFSLLKSTSKNNLWTGHSSFWW